MRARYSVVRKVSGDALDQTDQPADGDDPTEDHESSRAAAFAVVAPNRERDADDQPERPADDVPDPPSGLRTAARRTSATCAAASSFSAEAHRSSSSSSLRFRKAGLGFGVSADRSAFRRP